MGSRSLAIHPGALGDVLLAVPALRALRGAWPADALALAAQPRIGALLAVLGVVDEHLAFDALGLEALFVEEAPPPRVAALEGSARVVCWFAARDPVFVRRLTALVSGAAVLTVRPEDGVPVWEHLLRGVAPSGPARREPLEVPDALAAEGRRALEAAGWDGDRPLLLLHPGAGGESKRWPVEGFAAVAQTARERHGVALVAHEGPADRAAVAALLARLGSRCDVLRDPPLPVLAGALRHVAGWLGNDSGVSHLAAAVGAPAVALFTPDNVSWRPWAERARWLEVRTGALDPADLAAVLRATRGLLERRPGGQGER